MRLNIYLHHNKGWDGSSRQRKYNWLGRTVPTESRKKIIDYYTLGMRVKVLREVRGWTQTECCYMCGISIPKLSEIETGKCKNVTVKVLEKLAAGLGVTFNELIMEDKE